VGAQTPCPPPIDESSWFQSKRIVTPRFFQETPASTLALAVLMLALGITYWLMRERDDRLR
jgi:hypothetical protein